jgi:dihydroneopterin triphosphate diphosphatase
MPRAPINALVFPYRQARKDYEYAIFRRSDSPDEFWQGISGGAEDDETPMEAAIRESWEEGRIPSNKHFTQLDSTCTMPASIYRGTGWGPEIYVVREYSFGVDTGDHDIVVSEEHTDYRWLSLEDAQAIVKFPSNSHALGELSQRIQRDDL